MLTANQKCIIKLSKDIKLKKNRDSAMEIIRGPGEDNS
jgi:hypothetical protein